MILQYPKPSAIVGTDVRRPLLLAFSRDMARPFSPEICRRIGHHVNEDVNRMYKVSLNAQLLRNK